MHACGYVHMCVHSCCGQVSLGCLHQLLSTFLFARGLSLDLQLIGWLTSELRECYGLCTLSAGVAGTHHNSLCCWLVHSREDSGDLSSCPHAVQWAPYWLSFLPCSPLPLRLVFTTICLCSMHMQITYLTLWKAFTLYRNSHCQSYIAEAQPYFCMYSVTCFFPAV